LNAYRSLCTFDGQILGTSQKAQSIALLEASVGRLGPTIDYAVFSFILTIGNVLSYLILGKYYWIT